MDKVLLIDGMNQIFRASHVPFQKHELCRDCDDLADCHDPSNDRYLPHCECGNLNWIDGKCDQAPNQDFVIIYSFFRNLRPIIELFSPDKCFMVFEGRPQFRHDLYADYKANRGIVKTGSAPVQDNRERVYQAADAIIQLLRYLPITACRSANYEADDVVGSLAENVQDEEITVISNDNDYIQLLQRGYKSCRIYNPIKKSFMAAPEYPYVAWKSLSGDKADNIKGLVSAAKAKKLCTNPELFAEFLMDQETKSQFNINRQLIEFRSVPMEEIDLQEGEKNFEALRKEFEFMEFESIINESSWKKFCRTFECLKL